MNVLFQNLAVTKGRIWTVVEKYGRWTNTGGLETSSHPARHRLKKILDGVLKNFKPNCLQLLDYIVNIPGWLQSSFHTVLIVLHGSEIMYGIMTRVAKEV